MAKSIENDEYGADSPDLAVHLQGANLKYLEFEDDRQRMSDIGVKMKFLCDELEVQPYGNEDGMWKSLCQTLETGMSSITNVFTQSEVSTVQPIVWSEKVSLTSRPSPQSSGADWRSRSVCKSCCSVKAAIQDKTEWKLIEPVAMATLLNEDMKYRISVAPGRYECRVTGLCWESSDEVEMEYHLSDWDHVSEFLEKCNFQPCGPLLDVTIISGELTAVHLPHFLCLDSFPSLSDEVRVLHVEDAGVSLEKCELSCFSAKLLHPTFSPKGVLVRSGFPVKAHCEVLIYCTSTAHLTLHVYLVPCDSKIIESVQKQENRSIKIPKPRPDASLQMKNHYMLSTSCPSRIRPQKLKLRYTSQTPNFFEVYIKDAKDDFQLFLMSEEGESVWEADIRSAEYSRNLSCVGIHFVDLHRKSLIQRVKLVEPIADDLYPNIREEKYSKIKEAKTSQDKMRVIYDILLSGGQTLKDVFLQSLQQNEPDLVAELSQA
ncbi:NACHT, LRR and PYD domains-containing protein 1 homolog isoform X2 [Colossoma macropomum]|uniref:NACHT, LRR and PYD domains-containing protein 1 homolog isoform X2 n=1 Tax=Colossoma macropomum TaxID=42526 RepID=UPI001863A80B|nr:NACHT, LRR and PYD domains-containing protein 1 homolog isoform X2 [Colossoma macropomum]